VKAGGFDWIKWKKWGIKRSFGGKLFAAGEASGEKETIRARRKIELFRSESYIKRPPQKKFE